MSKEKEIQDELERYWGQLDRIEGAIKKNKHRIGAVGGQMERVERMLRWIVLALQAEFHFKSMTNEQKEKMENIVKLCPDISDILEGKE